MAKKDDKEEKKREEALERALEQIKKQFGKGAIMKMGEGGYGAVEGIPTGGDIRTGGVGEDDALLPHNGERAEAGRRCGVH